MSQEKRKPKNASFGVFPSATAVRSVSSAELSKVYFASTKQAQFNWQSGTMPPEDRTENFDQIHSMGKKNTKYMKFHPSRAPLVDRTACKYNQEFHSHPLGDCETNKALAENFKQGGKSMSQSSPFLGLKSSYMDTFAGHDHPSMKAAKQKSCAPRKVLTQTLGGTGGMLETVSNSHSSQSSPFLGLKSSYMDTFAGHDHPSMKAAKQKSCAPRKVLTQTLGGTGGMLETVSNSHSSHRVPPMHLAKAVPPLLPKPNITLCERSDGGFFRSQAKRDFVNPAIYAASMPPSLTQQAEFPKLPGGVVDDEMIYNCRRACFLSPGQ